MGFTCQRRWGNDLSGVYTLLSDHFYYFGGLPVEVPEHLRPVIHLGRGHKSAKNDPYVEGFVAWITTKFEPNRLYGMPRGMPQTFERVEIGRKP
jgi:hypothetical protein